MKNAEYVVPGWGITVVAIGWYWNKQRVALRRAQRVLTPKQDEV